MKTQKIIIKDIVVGYTSNSDGLILKAAIEQSINASGSVILSFEGVTSASSSFLNSSIGEIIDKYGLIFLKNRIKITNYTPSIALMIQKYVSNFKETA